jgi:hypothetical protein
VAAAAVSDEEDKICLCNLPRHLSRCVAEPIGTFARQQQQAQPGQQVRPVRRAAARRPVYIGTQWRAFNPRVIVVILRQLRNRIIDFIILLDLRRLAIVLLFGRRIGIRLGIAGVDLPSSTSTLWWLGGNLQCDPLLNPC